ncbi:MAG: hypothetical protein GKR99_14020 [Rhodobacteraceae bacterium]|nr:hypothetical protein [Paracoccaceae bacterium]
MGTYSVEGILGTVSAVSGDNDGPGDPEIERQFLAVAASLKASDQLRIDGLLGRIDGDTTTSGSNGDAFHEFDHASIDLTYAVSDRWAIGVGATVGYGNVDDVPNPGRLHEWRLSATHSFADPNMSAFIEARRSSYDDPAESDYVIEEHVALGFTWTFGDHGAARQRNGAALPNYSEWLAIADGGLE